MKLSSLAPAIRSLLARLAEPLAFTAALGVFGLVVFALYRLTGEVRYDDVVASLVATPVTDLLLAVFFTGLSYAALVAYDFNALAYIHRNKVPPVTVAMTAFSAYAVSNSVGFGPLSGGAIRYRVYTKFGLSPEDIARIVAFITFSFGIGLATVTALAVLPVANHLGSAMGLDPLALRTGAVAALALIAGLAWLGHRGKPVKLGKLTLTLPDTATAARQFLVTALDIAASASVLYVLMPHTGLGWPSFLAIYAAAIGLGVLSHVPAGLGVFEAVMVAALSGGDAGVEQILSALVLYRIIYYVLPMVTAIAILSVSLVRPLATRLPVAALAQLAPVLTSALAFLCGTMLVLSSVTPTPDVNLDFLSDVLPLPLIEGAHFLASILGLVLILAARGLQQRLDGALVVAIAASLAAMVFSLVKAAAVVEAGLLALLVFSLVATRHRFDRRASLINQPLSPPWLFAMLVVLAGACTILFFVYRDVEYSHDLWWQFEFSEEAPRSLRAALGLAIFGTAAGLFALLRPVVHHMPPEEAHGLEKATAIVMAQDVADANLVRMGDKRVMFSHSGKSFLMYGCYGRSFIAFLDPVGEADELPELVWQFVEFARAEGGRAVFYQVSPAILSPLADAGLRAFKLGELAEVRLDTFDLKGGRWANLRQSVSRGERDGLTFALLPPEAVPAAMEDLRAVSDAWLAEHDSREKGFSLGVFDPDYVASQPVAVLRVEERIVAFATVMVTDTRAEGTVDLMRFHPDAPKGAMDFLFVKIMLHLREEGYRTFNLGMAPLAGIRKREAAPVWDRLGGAVYDLGERFYNFKGLRAFKQKFNPHWQPRYLAVSGGGNPLIALMDVTLLIGGGIKGVVGK